MQISVKISGFMSFIDRFTNKKMKDDLKKQADVKAPKKEKAEKKEKEVVKVKKTDKQLNGNAFKILLQPIVSEKCAIAESRGTYTFSVARDTNKTEVKKAIKQVYGVTPKKIRMINVEGRKARYGQHNGRRSDWKKAIVSLPAGQSIDVHEGV